MVLEDELSASAWPQALSCGSQLSKRVPPYQQSLTNFESTQHQQNWDNPSVMDYSMNIEQQFSELSQQLQTPSLVCRNLESETKFASEQDDSVKMCQDVRKIQSWDPSTMLSNLSFLEQKIHQLQDMVHLIVDRSSQVEGCSNELVIQQQQLMTADLTSIIIQLISTAGSLLPSVRYDLSSVHPSLSQLEQLGGTSSQSLVSLNADVQGPKKVVKKVDPSSNPNDLAGNNSGAEQNYTFEEHESKDEDDPGETENLPPGSYEILQLEKEEILAPHTHFCMMCGKGFKRDANLRMHMRGHGDEYKTPAALAKPNKEANTEPVLIKRYSCPYMGCKRNKDHKKFQPLKTILCVKNHYKRTHCDKSYTCSRCHTKKFSVIADLKTHEKHCGKDKWLCSCGTTFSRKDKLFGHIALFQGHTPAVPPDDNTKLSSSALFGGVKTDFSFNLSSAGIGTQRPMDGKDGAADDPTNYFSPLNFDSCNFVGFHDFSRAPFEDSESSFSFLMSESCNYPSKSDTEGCS